MKKLSLKKKNSVSKKRSLKLKPRNNRITNKHRNRGKKGILGGTVEDDMREQRMRQDYPLYAEALRSSGIEPPSIESLIENSRRFAAENSRINQQVNSQLSCPICFENMTQNDSRVTRCNHRFHKHCLLQSCRSQPPNGKFCPLCRANINDDCQSLQGWSLR